jgi:hypothetical protein
LKSDKDKKGDEVIASHAEIPDQGVEENASDSSHGSCESVNGSNFGRRESVGRDCVEITRPNSDSESTEADGEQYTGNSGCILK